MGFFLFIFLKFENFHFQGHLEVTKIILRSFFLYFVIVWYLVYTYLMYIFTWHKFCCLLIQPDLFSNASSRQKLGRLNSWHFSFLRTFSCPTWQYLSLKHPKSCEIFISYLHVHYTWANNALYRRRNKNDFYRKANK